MRFKLLKWTRNPAVYREDRLCVVIIIRYDLYDINLLTFFALASLIVTWSVEVQLYVNQMVQRWSCVSFPQDQSHNCGNDNFLQTKRSIRTRYVCFNGLVSWTWRGLSLIWGSPLVMFSVSTGRPDLMGVLTQGRWEAFLFFFVVRIVLVEIKVCWLFLLGLSTVRFSGRPPCVSFDAVKTVLDILQRVLHLRYVVFSLFSERYQLSPIILTCVVWAGRLLRLLKIAQKCKYFSESSVHVLWCISFNDMPYWISLVAMIILIRSRRITAWSTNPTS